MILPKKLALKIKTKWYGGLPNYGTKPKDVEII